MKNIGRIVLPIIILLLTVRINAVPVKAFDMIVRNLPNYGRLQALTREITRQLKDEILVTPRVKLVPKGALPKSEGKAVRVKDLRKTF